MKDDHHTLGYTAVEKKYTLYFAIRASFFQKYTNLDIRERTGGSVIK